MKYKLIDVRQEVEENVQFGTCEICMSIGTLSYAVAVVEDEDGNELCFENGFWSYGDWIEYSYREISNVVDFAAWFREQDLSSDLDSSEFWSLVDNYHEEKGDE